jgi:hypothetical protein
VIEILCLGDGQNRAENLFLENARFRIHVRDDGGLDEIAFAGRRRATGDDAPFALAGFDVAENIFLPM